MECRRIQLEQSINGLNVTDVPLVQLCGTSFEPAGFADDPGIYYFIPWMTKHLGIPLDPAIDLFLGTLLLLGALISGACLFFTFKTWACRAISIVGSLLLTGMAARCSDLYVSSYFAVAATVPFFIVWNQIRSPFHLKIGLTIAWSGLIIGYCNQIRCQSGTGALLFLLSWIALNGNFSKKEKLSSAVLLSVFVLLPYLHFHRLEFNRDSFLTKKNPSHNSIAVTHPKWHNIYIGFGYLKNKYGIEYNDTISSNKALSISPNVQFCSAEYESILREQCWRLLRTDCVFVLKTLLCKALVILLKLALFANFGLLFWFYVRAPLRFTAPFLIATLFYSLPGLLTMPYTAYVLGALSLSTLFGVTLIGLRLEKYQKYEAA
ncbi:MAG: hypothetical protein WCF19_03580 [Chlamydiales bacterium]